MRKSDGFSADTLIREDEHAAIAASHLRSLSPDMISGFFSEATRLRFRAGTVFHREGDTRAHVELVVSGLVRVYVTAPDGRMMTARYCRPGGLIGAASLFSSPFWLPAAIQAVTDADLVALPAPIVRRAAERDLQVARALLDELSERVLSFLTEVPSAFATVRQRVARHLLDLASENQNDARLIAAIGQQELADAVGTAREVVVRALRKLREDGLIRTERQRIVVLKADRLAVDACGGAVETKDFQTSGTQVAD